jgi:hypothetical protein
VPWDAAHPFQGLGFRGIQAAASGYTLQERGVA